MILKLLSQRQFVGGVWVLERMAFSQNDGQEYCKEVIKSKGLEQISVEDLVRGSLFRPT